MLFYQECSWYKEPWRHPIWARVHCSRAAWAAFWGNWTLGSPSGTGWGQETNHSSYAKQARYLDTIWSKWNIKLSIVVASCVQSEGFSARWRAMFQQCLGLNVAEYSQPKTIIYWVMKSLSSLDSLLFFLCGEIGKKFQFRTFFLCFTCLKARSIGCPLFPAVGKLGRWALLASV